MSEQSKSIEEAQTVPSSDSSTTGEFRQSPMMAALTVPASTTASPLASRDTVVPDAVTAVGVQSNAAVTTRLSTARMSFSPSVCSTSRMNTEELLTANVCS